MRNFLVFIALISTTQLKANMENREGSILQDKETGSIMYFTCGMRDITGECNSYKGYLERSFPEDVITILPMPAPLEKILLHSSLYTVLLDSKDVYITGEPINLKKYNTTKWFFDKTNGNKPSLGNIIIKALVSPVTLAVAVVETIVDQPQNLYMKSKSLVLKAKYKKPLRRLFSGKKNKAYSVRGRKFNKLVELVKNIK